MPTARATPARSTVEVVRQVRRLAARGRLPRHDERGRPVAAVDDARCSARRGSRSAARRSSGRAPGSSRTRPRRRACSPASKLPGRARPCQRARGREHSRAAVALDRPARSRDRPASQLNSTRTLQVHGIARLRRTRAARRARPRATPRRRRPRGRRGCPTSSVASAPRSSRKLTAMYCPVTSFGSPIAITSPRSSSSARWQKRLTARMSWVTNRIVRPSVAQALELARSTSAGTRRRRPRAPRRSAGRRRPPGSSPRTPAARTSRTSSSSASGPGTPRAPANPITLSTRSRASCGLEAQQDRVQHDVVLRGEVGVEADAQLDERRHAAVDARSRRRPTR